MQPSGDSIDGSARICGCRDDCCVLRAEAEEWANNIVWLSDLHCNREQQSIHHVSSYLYGSRYYDFATWLQSRGYCNARQRGQKEMPFTPAHIKDAVHAFLHEQSRSHSSAWAGNEHHTKHHGLMGHASAPLLRRGPSRRSRSKAAVLNKPNANRLREFILNNAVPRCPTAKALGHAVILNPVCCRSLFSSESTR